MARERMTISWDELNSDKVEKKIQAQQAISAAREHYDRAQVPTAPARKPRFQFIYNTLFYMAMFGALGGLVGWTFGILLHLRPNAQVQARTYIAQFEQIKKDTLDGRYTDEEAGRALRSLKREAGENAFFAAHLETELKPASERAERLTQIAQNEAWKNFIADLLFYGVGGMMIAACLAMAETIMERNWQGAIINGSVGAATGLVGGLVVAVLGKKIVDLTTNTHVVDAGTGQMVLAHVVQWGLLGLFLSLGPGLLLRNGKRMLIGMGGGLIGGIIGGLLFVPIASFANSDRISEFVSNGELMSRLVGLVAIGLIAGLATGFIENVAKNGWMKVQEGLIAGKQFVLYRNPTYIGSSPACHIYLFKDLQVGRRHAAVHIVPGGFEIEDLPLGSATFVNGKQITRLRLKSGDDVQIGSTVFKFLEKPKPNA